MLVFTGGALQYSSVNTTDYSSKFANSSSAIAIDTNSQNVNFGSSLAATNSGGLTKLGSGTLTLTANNAYTGTTTISNGTHQIGNATNSAAILAAGTVTDNSALTFNFSNFNASESNVITGSGTVSYTGGIAGATAVNLTTAPTATWEAPTSPMAVRLSSRRSLHPW